MRFSERTADGRLRAPVFHGLVVPEDVAPDVPGGPFSSEGGSRTVQEGSRSVTLTNLGKPYWPREGITKGHLLDHYLRMAPVLVPHLVGRPMILKRYPDGIEGDFFFQHSVADAPGWMRRVDLCAVASRTRSSAATSWWTTRCRCCGWSTWGASS